MSITIGFNLGKGCNLKCSYCLNNLKEHDGVLHIDIPRKLNYIIKVIEKTQDKTTAYIVHGGELLFLKETSEIFTTIKKKFPNIKLYWPTNGTNFSKFKVIFDNVSDFTSCWFSLHVGSINELQFGEFKKCLNYASKFGDANVTVVMYDGLDLNLLKKFYYQIKDIKNIKTHCFIDCHIFSKGFNFKHRHKLKKIYDILEIKKHPFLFVPRTTPLYTLRSEDLKKCIQGDRTNYNFDIEYINDNFEISLDFNEDEVSPTLKELVNIIKSIKY